MQSETLLTAEGLACNSFIFCVWTRNFNLGTRLLCAVQKSSFVIERCMKGSYFDISKHYFSL